MATSICNLACDICHKDFNILKMLECDHTFCLQCLEDLVDNKPGQNHVNCLLCQSQTQISDGGVKDCASNLHIEKKSRCLEHPLKEVEFYCENCSKVVCSKCAVIMHRDHTCVDLEVEETKLDIVNELKSLLQPLICSICELQKYSDILKDMLLDVEDAAQIASSTVDYQVQKFCFEIIQIGEEAKYVIMETLNKDKTQLENLMNNAHKLNDELNNCVRTSRILLEDTSIAQVVAMIAKVRTLNEESNCTILDTSVPTLRFPCFLEAVLEEPVFTLDQLGSLAMLEQAEFVAIRSQRNQRRLDEEQVLHEPSGDPPITASISSSSNSVPADELYMNYTLPNYQNQVYAGPDTVCNQAYTTSLSPTTKRGTTEELGEQLGERNTSSNYQNQLFVRHDTISKQTDTENISPATKIGPETLAETLDERSSSSDTVSKQTYTTNISPASSDTVSKEIDTKNISPTTMRVSTEEPWEVLSERSTSPNYQNQMYLTGIGPEELEEILDERNSPSATSKQTDTTNISPATKIVPEEHGGTLSERRSSSDTVSKQTDTTNIPPTTMRVPTEELGEALSERSTSPIYQNQIYLTKIGPEELEEILDERSSPSATVSKQTDTTNISPATKIVPEEHGGTLSERRSSSDTVIKQTDTTNISPATKIGPEEHGGTLSERRSSSDTVSRQTDITNTSPTTKRLDERSTSPDYQNQVYSLSSTVSKQTDTTTANKEPAEELEEITGEQSTLPNYQNQLFVGSDTASTTNSGPEELEKVLDERRSTSLTLFVQPDAASEQAVKQWSALEEKLGVDESSFVTTLNLNQINQSKFFKSPDIKIIQGLTWCIAARKRIMNWKTTLDVYLLLTKDENKAVRMCNVDFTVMLMNFKDKNQSVIEHRGGEFNPGGILGGSFVDDFINWERLTNLKNGYIDEQNNFKLKFTLNIIKIDV